MPKTTAATVDTNSRTLQIPPAIMYKLSEKLFLDLGWTICPYVMRQEQQVTTMKAKFLYSEICPWFREREENVVGKYPDGRTLYVARKNGTGRIYYPNGRVAVHIEKTYDQIPQTKVWIFHSGEVEGDGTRRLSRFCALFESLGNAVVYDHLMRKRLVYNQNEGIWYGSSKGVRVRWQWHNLKVKNAIAMPATDEESITPRTCLRHKTMSSSSRVSSQTRSDCLNLKSELLKMEMDFCTRIEHIRYVDTGRIFPLEVSPLKPIVLRLNKYLALRIFSQSDISLSFFAEGQQTQLKLGVLYNPHDKLMVTKLETDPGPNEIFCPFENFPANNKSLLKFRKLIGKPMSEGPSSNVLFRNI